MSGKRASQRAKLGPKQKGSIGRVTALQFEEHVMGVGLLLPSSCCAAGRQAKLESVWQLHINMAAVKTCTQSCNEWDDGIQSAPSSCGRI